MKTLKISLPLSKFEDLHVAADGRGKFCRVEKTDLLALLMDHSKALAMLQDMNVPLEDSYADCSQVRKARQG